MITYQQEFLLNVKSEIHSLLQEDYQEIEHDKDRRKLNPNWKLYEALEDSGSLYIFTVRDNGQLVGYFTVVIHEDLHDTDNICVTQDIIFLTKEYRKGMTGVRLIRFGEECLKQDGHKYLTITTTMQNPIGPLMKRLGYSKIEEKFERKF